MKTDLKEMFPSRYEKKLLWYIRPASLVKPDMKKFKVECPKK